MAVDSNALLVLVLFAMLGALSGVAVAGFIRGLQSYIGRRARGRAVLDVFIEIEICQTGRTRGEHQMDDVISDLIVDMYGIDDMTSRQYLFHADAKAIRRYQCWGCASLALA